MFYHKKHSINFAKWADWLPLQDVSRILKENIMQKLVASINEQIQLFQENAALQVENGNKAAGGRARKASLELEKQLKAFRKASIEASK